MSSSVPGRRYRHERHAGNWADRWKHRILEGIVDRLLADQPPRQPFRYFETHAGRGVYRPGFNKRANRGGFYEGSWRRVLNRCRLADRPCRLTLVDRFVRPLKPRRPGRRARIMCRRGDGYDAGFIQRQHPDLVFIDPPFWPDPDTDWRALRRLLAALSGHGPRVLIWYPGSGSACTHMEQLFVEQAGVAIMESSAPAGHSGGLATCGLIAIGFSPRDLAGLA